MKANKETTIRRWWAYHITQDLYEDWEPVAAVSLEEATQKIARIWNTHHQEAIWELRPNFVGWIVDVKWAASKINSNSSYYLVTEEEYQRRGPWGRRNETKQK